MNVIGGMRRYMIQTLAAELMGEAPDGWNPFESWDAAGQVLERMQKIDGRPDGYGHKWWGFCRALLGPRRSFAMDAELILHRRLSPAAIALAAYTALTDETIKDEEE